VSPRPQRPQRGVTLLIILLILAVMLTSALVLARGSVVDTLLAGNIERGQGAALAADVGIATAFEELKALTDTGIDRNWYFTTPLSNDIDGLPEVPDWTAVRELQVGPYQVHYIVERLCRTLTVTDDLSQCLMSENPPKVRNAIEGEEPVATPAQRSYRATVRVSGPKGTQSWAQALLTRP
jgi:type IV pilus assembly protein PilX